MKKHERIITLFSVFATVSLVTIASGLAYAYVCHARNNKESCPCNATVVEMANKRNISHFYAAAYIERQIRERCSFRDEELVWKSDEIKHLEACRKWHAQHDPR